MKRGKETNTMHIYLCVSRNNIENLCNDRSSYHMLIRAILYMYTMNQYWFGFVGFACFRQLAKETKTKAERKPI